MKRNLLTLVGLLVLLLPVNAQFITIGSGTNQTTSTGSDPINGFYESNRYQVVYTAAELSAAGLPAGSTLTGLGWSVSGDYGGGVLANYTINLAHTSAVDAATHNSATLTQVVNPFGYNPTVVTAGNHDMITFNTTFVWNGVDNILVDVCMGPANPFTSPYGQVRTIAASTTNGSRRGQCDGCASGICNIPTDATGTPLGLDDQGVNTTKPQVRFNFTPPPCAGVPLAGTITPSSYNICSGQTINLTSTGASPAFGGLTYQWQVSPLPGGPYFNVVGGTGANTTSYTSAPLAAGTYYAVLKVRCAAGPDSAYSNEVTVNVAPTPTASASSNSPICVGAGIDINLTGTTDVGTSFIWTGPNAFNSTLQNPIVTSPAAINSGIYSFVSIAGSCTSSVATTTVIVNEPPPTPSTPVGAVVCSGAANAPISVTPAAGGSSVLSSGTINIAIPDLNPVGISNILASSLPSSAVITGLSVNLNITHTFDGDLDIYLKAPNGTQIELSTDNGAGGDNFTNTTFSSAGVTNITAGTAPFTGTFLPEGSFPSLYSVPNGNWTLFIADDASGDVGTLHNWTLTITYSIPPTNISWYDASTGGALQGTGNPFETVGTLLLPNTSVPGTYTFYAEASNASCTNSTRLPVTVEVNPVLVTLDPINVSCAGAGDGSFAINTVVCGLAPFTYSVDGGVFGPIPTNLLPGTYSVVVKDDNGLDGAPYDITITEPGIVGNPLSTISDTACTGTGSVMISGTPAGTSTISWWDAPTGGSMLGTGSPFETIGSSVLPTSTTAGVYTFYAQGDSSICSSVGRVAATVTLFDVIAELTPIDITCNGANDGSFSLGTVTCGNPGYTYAVDGGSFGPIPTNLTPGTHTVVIEDALGGLSGIMSLDITEPTWIVPSPNVTNEIICVGDSSAILTGAASIADTITLVLPFDVASQPVDAAGDPGTLFSSVTLPAIPGTIISATITYPGLNSTGGSWNSEVRIALTGAINSPGVTSPGSVGTGGVFTYSRPITPASVNTAGGTVDLGYWESYNDLGGADAIFPLGAGVGNITIKYLPAATITWFDASTLGTNLGTTDSIESVGTVVLPNTNTPGVYNFYAEAEYNGCYSSTRTLATVTIGAYPVVSLGPDSAYCVTHTLDAGNPGMNYLWNDASTSQTIAVLDTGTYWVDVTSTLGCTTRDSIDLVINPLPVVGLGPDTSSCGSYTLDPGPQYPGSTYLWNDMTTNPTLFIITSGDYDVTVTDVNGCSNSDTVTVNVPPITYTNIGVDTTLCTNATGFTLDATQVGVTYLWQDGSTNATYFVNLPGTYWVEITNFVGCTSVDSIVITSVNPVQTNIDVNFVTMSSATLDAGSGFSSYLWSTSASTQTITVNANGTYYVEVTDANNCITTDTVNIIFSLGVFNPNGSNTMMKLYPNPSEGVFNVAIDNLETSDLVMEVMDMNGRVVYNRYVGSVSGSTIEPFNLTNLRAGTYTLRLTANGQSSSLRFIIK